MEPLVIIGAGQAGAQVATSLRQGGFDGDVILLGDEPSAPYQRPPLSKKFLAGELAADRLLLKADQFWDATGVELRIGARAVALRPGYHAVDLEDGSVLHYAKLLLATGARSRSLPVAGADLAGIHFLRTIADVDKLRSRMATGCRLAIVGAGYIGMEVAAVCQQLGMEVTIIEAQDRVMQRVVSPIVSTYFAGLHGMHGVDIQLSSPLEAFVGADRVCGVKINGKPTLETDCALVAVGGVPDTELAQGAGLACADGIVVDAHCRTCAPDIFAAGDCTRFPSALYGRDIRLESVQNAIDQAKAAAASMVGERVEYNPVPWFWSDQYDTKLQIAGLNDGYDETRVEGDPETGMFAVSYFSDQRLLAVDAINMPRAHMLARRKLGQ